MLHMIEKLLTAWSETARRGGLVLGLVIVAATGFAGYYAATHLKVNTDTSSMLDPNLPFQQRTTALRDAFPQIKTDIVVISRSSNLDEVDAYIANLREALLNEPDKFTSVFAPAQEPFFRNNGLMYLSEAELEKRLTQISKAAGLIETLIQSPNIGTLFSTLASNDALAERSDLGKDTLQALYKEIGDVVEASLEGTDRPFSWMGALDPDTSADKIHTRLLYATPILDYSRLQPAKSGIESIRAQTQTLNSKFDGRVSSFVTGDPALRVEELEAVTTGIGLSMLLSLILVSLLLLVCYRSIGMALLTLASLMITLVLTSAFAAAFIGELNLVSVAFTVLLIGLGLDFAIHLLLHVQERRTAGQDITQALRGAFKEVGPALAIAAPTTALAFLSFVPTKFDGIAQLGIIAGAGVIIAFFVSVTFLPAALAGFPNLKPRAHSGQVRAFFDGLSKYSGPIAIATIILGGFALLLMPQVRFDADQMSLRNPNSPSVQGFNILFEDQDTVPYRLARLVRSEEEARNSAAKASALDLVASTRSLPDFVPDSQDEKLELIDYGAGTLVFALDATPNSVDGPPATEGIASLRHRLQSTYNDGPGARLGALLADVEATNDPAFMGRIQNNIFTYWPQLTSLLADQMQADYIEIDALPDALKNRYRSEAGDWRVDILPKQDLRDRQALDEFVDQVEAVFPDLAGGAYQAKKAGEIISTAMLQATAIAFAVIAIFLWLLVRRLTPVMLILFPLMLAAVLTAATGVLLNVPFNYANVIVLPLLIGIGVDSGIHLVLRHDQVAAGEGVFGTSTPRAVLFAALTTVASFGSLMLSPHRGTASMGTLLSIAIAFTLICTLLVLPAAFRFADKRSASRNT